MTILLCVRCSAELLDESKIDWWGYPFCEACGEHIRQEYIQYIDRQKGSQNDDA
jgi:hypothetical protein